MEAKTIKVTKVQDDGFILVSHQRKKKHGSKRCEINSKNAYSESYANDKEDENFCFRKHTLIDILNEVENSEFFSEFKRNLGVVLKYMNLSRTRSEDTSADLVTKGSLMDVQNTLDIICYGLGKFTSSVISRYQLGFLLALKGMFGTNCAYVYDPIFSEKEIEFLEEVGLNVLKINEEAKRTIERTTIFFMPHCELELYNNLFSVNWSPKNLQKLILIGNNFENYKIQLCGGRFKQTAKYVYYVTGFESEIVIANSFYLTDIFNDLCVHYFRLQDLPSAQCDMWKNEDDLLHSSESNSNVDQLSELLSTKVI